MSSCGCSFDSLIWCSFIARNRFQSVLETFEEVRFFMSCRLSKRDNADLLRCFGVNNGNGWVLGSSRSIDFYIGIVGQVFANSRPIIQLRIVAKDPLLNEGQAPLGHEMRLANVWTTAS